MSLQSQCDLFRSFAPLPAKISDNIAFSTRQIERLSKKANSSLGLFGGRQPCSALDLITTEKIEQPIDRLKQD